MKMDRDPFDPRLIALQARSQRPRPEPRCSGPAWPGPRRDRPLEHLVADASIAELGENLMRTLRWIRRLPLLGLLLLTAAPALHAESKTFKCMIEGRTVYQQTVCPVSSQSDDVKPAAEAASASHPAASHPCTRSAASSAAPSAGAVCGTRGRAEKTGAQVKEKSESDGGAR